MRHGITTPWGLLGVCALMALSALSAHAQDSGTVRGIVTTAAGEPVPEVAVTVVELGLTTPRHDATTDEYGRFERTGLPPGHYRVSASTDDLGSQIFRVLVQAGGAADVHFVLEAGRAAAPWLRAPRDDRAAAAAAFESGVQANRSGDIEQAIAYFESALQVMPSCVDCHFNIGVAHSRQGRFADAVAAFRSALDIRDDYAAAYYGLADVFYKQNLPDDAAAARVEANRITVRSLEATRARAQDALARGEAFLNSGNVDDAMRQFDAALAADGTLVDAHYWIGRARDVAGDGAAATRSLTRYLGAAPNGEFVEDARRRLETLRR
ncbi:MAG: tetratricopeptide repeat protein [bacterium]